MPSSNNKKYLIAISLEVAFVIYAIATASVDNAGAGWTAAWVVFFLMPATLIAWGFNHRSYTKQIASGKPVVIDPHWHSRNKKIIIGIILVFVIGLIASLIGSLTDYNGNIGCKPTDTFPKSLICGLKGESYSSQ